MKNDAENERGRERGEGEGEGIKHDQMKSQQINCTFAFWEPFSVKKKHRQNIATTAYS